MYNNMFPTPYTAQSCFGSTNPAASTFCRTDNTSLTRGFDGSVQAAGINAINTEMNTDFAPTDLAPSLQAPPVYTGTAETDIIYQVRSGLPSGNVAYTWCDNPYGLLNCDQHYVAFQSQTIASKIGFVCHESGHAVGLTHGTQADPPISNTDSRLGCMVRPTSDGATLGPNNIAIINSFY